MSSADLRDDQITSLKQQLDRASRANTELRALLTRYSSSPPSVVASAAPGPTPVATLELTVQSTASAETHRLVAEWSRPRQLPVRCERAFKVDERELLAAGTSKYGEALGCALFDGNVRELFAQARADESFLRVLLAVEADALRALRWERLHAPFGDRWEPLGLNQRAPFSLYLPSASDRRFRPFGRADLNALVVVASPEPDCTIVPHFDEPGALKSVLNGLGKIPSRVLGKSPEAEGRRPTLTEICRQLQERRYTLLHIVCHGAVSKAKGETVIFLDGDQGGTVPVPASEVIQQLGRLGDAHGLPHFVFLSVCDSAKPEAEGALGGLAQRLVREVGMPAVIAMTEKISQETALALGAEFYRILQTHGEVDRALTEACVEVRKRSDVTVPVPALFSRLGGRPLFVDTPDAPLAPREFAAGIERLDALFATRAPSLVGEVKAHATALLEASDRDVASLDKAQLLRREEALAALEGLCDEALEVSFTALARGAAPPEYNAQCPFPGLKAFRDEDRRFFFGRGALVSSLVDRFETQPFMVVFGGSGSGKSSVVMAGVIPALRERNGTLQVRQMTPGAHPLATLQASLAELGDAPDSVLFIDQFEEVFTLCRDPKERSGFLDALLSHARLRRRVMFTMRADFFDECATHPGLHAVVGRMPQLVAPMSPEELRAAMEQQAAQAGLRFETGLCELILTHLGAEPGTMPLLQHALRAVWERRHGRWLLVSEYNKLGGIQQAIAQTAEEHYEAIVGEAADDASRARIEARIRDVFLRLTRLDDDATPGAARRDTRQRVRFADLVPAGADHEVIRDLIDRLVDARLVHVTAPRLVDATHTPAPEDQEVEVAHEALIRKWTRLVGWLDEGRVTLRLRSTITRAADEWLAHPGVDAINYLVHTGLRLQEAEALRHSGRLTLSEREARYLDACIDRRDRAAREREARNAVFVVNDLVKRDVTRAVRMAQLACRLDPTGALPQTELSLNAAYNAAVSGRAPFYLARLVHKGPVKSVAFSPDGGRVLTASSDGAARLWSRDGKFIVALPHGARVERAAFSPDGSRIVSVGYGFEVRLWDGDGQPLASLEGHGPAQFDDVCDVAWSPDGARFVTVGADAKVLLWDAAGTLVEEINDHSAVVRSVTWSPDGARFVTCGVWNDSVARLYTRDGARVAELGEDEGERVTEHSWQRGVTWAAFAPLDGGRIVTTSNDHTVKLWDGDGAHIATLRDHTAEVVQAAFLPGGDGFVSASRDGSAIVWSADAKPLRVLRPEGNAPPLRRLAVSPDGALIVCGADDGSVTAWGADGTVVASYKGHESGINALVFDREGACLMSASEDRKAVLWKPLPPAQVTLRHDGEVVSALFVPDVAGSASDAIVTASNDLIVRRWRASDGAPVWSAGGFESDNYGNRRVYSLDVSPDGRSAVTTSTDYELRVWELAGGTVIARWDTTEGESSNSGGWAGAQVARFSPDGTRIITGDFGGQVRVWSLSGKPLLELARRHPNEVGTVAIAPSGALIATGCHDNLVRLWDGTTGALIREMAGHSGAVCDVRFSRDGATILSASDDQSARLWDLEGRTLHEMERHAGPVRSANFSPDGQRIVTASHDQTARIWDVRGRPVGAITGHTGILRWAAFSPDGSAIVTASLDRTARVWPQARAILAELEGRWVDIDQVTREELDDQGFDVAICGPLLDR